LKVIAIIFLSYLLIKYLGRIIAPFLIRFFAKKMQSRFQDQLRKQYKNYQDYNNEGDITIKKNTKKKSTNLDNIGDYVDYEEIE